MKEGKRSKEERDERRKEMKGGKRSKEEGDERRKVR